MTDTKLKENFKVAGRFYTIEYNTKHSEECRSVLEIRRVNNLAALNEGVIVMMNPGKSKPMDNAYKIKTLKANNFENEQILAIPLVETIPDSTPYKIMSIMEANRLNYVKVINLSDLREPKCELFYQKIEALELSDQDKIHSIFSKKRKVELEDVFKQSENLPVIVAWGVNKKLENLITLAIDSGKLKKRIGYAKNKAPENIFYYHSMIHLSKKEKSWSDHINGEIEKWQREAFFKQLTFRIKKRTRLY